MMRCLLLIYVIYVRCKITLSFLSELCALYFFKSWCLAKCLRNAPQIEVAAGWDTFFGLGGGISSSEIPWENCYLMNQTTFQHLKCIKVRSEMPSGGGHCRTWRAWYKYCKEAQFWPWAKSWGWTGRTRNPQLVKIPILFVSDSHVLVILYMSWWYYIAFLVRHLPSFLSAVITCGHHFPHISSIHTNSTSGVP